MTEPPKLRTGVRFLYGLPDICPRDLGKLVQPLRLKRRVFVGSNPTEGTNFEPTCNEHQLVLKNKQLANWKLQKFKRLETSGIDFSSYGWVSKAAKILEMKIKAYHDGSNLTFQNFTKIAMQELLRSNASVVEWYTLWF